MTSLRTVRGPLGPLVLVTGNDTGHTLSTSGHSGKAGRKECGRLGFVVGQFTNLGRSTTGDVMCGTGPTWKSREPIFTNVNRIDTKHLLIATDSGDIGADTETWTDELFLYGRKVVHATLIIHTIAHVQDFLTTTSLLHGDVRKTLHLPLPRNIHDRSKIIFYYRSFDYRWRTLFDGRGDRLSTQSSTSIN
jgi:hypothetical protein